MTSLASILIGKKVRFLGCSCCNLKEGKIYKIEADGGRFFIKEEDFCYHANCWEILDPIIFKPKSHKHTFACQDCGVKK